MQEPFDRAAMIEAASRGLRQQMARCGGNGVRDRPRSKGPSQHDFHSGPPTVGVPSAGLGSPGAADSAAAMVAVHSADPRGAGPAAASSSSSASAESAQRRIRSAENQHRQLRATDAPDAPPCAGPAGVSSPTGAGPIAVPSGGSAGGAAVSAIDTYGGPPEEALEEDLPIGSPSSAAGADEDVAAVLQDYHRELKRPLSRKKDPSASAAAGLGAFAGPARVTDAFEQRKMRQPIPVESWGPRPPSRAGIPSKAAPLDEGLDVDAKTLLGQPRARLEGGSTASGRPASKAVEQVVPLGSKVVGGTWAAARAEPRAAGDSRRCRDKRGASGSRGSPENANYATDDLGIFGCGQQGLQHAKAANPRLSKSLSGAADRGGQLGPRTAPWQLNAGGPFAPHLTDPTALGALEVSGYSLGGDPGGSPWSASGGSCGSPPTRAKLRAPDGVSVEDVDEDLMLSALRRDATPPQVIVTRSGQAGKNRGNQRRGSNQGPARDREQNMPFNTSLDVDFLSLFAS